MCQFISSIDRLDMYWECTEVKNKELCLCKQINTFHTKQRGSLPQILSVHRGRERNLCTQAAVSVGQHLKTLWHDCDAQVRVLPAGDQVRPQFWKSRRSVPCKIHSALISEILRPYTDQPSAHSQQNDHKQRELIGRDVSECLVMRIIVGQRQRGWCEWSWL